MSGFRAYVEQHQTRMMHHAAKAVDASNAWRLRDAELARKFKAEGLSRYAASQRKAGDMDLGDAWSAYQFHAGKAQMHSAVLQGLAAAGTLRSWTAGPGPTEQTNQTAASAGQTLADGADADGASRRRTDRRKVDPAGGCPVDHAAPAPAVPVETTPGTAGVTPTDRAAAHLGLVGTVRDDEDEPDDAEAPVPPLPDGIYGYQAGGRTRRPMNSPTGQPTEGAPIRTARSGASGGAAGTGAYLPHPTRGGAAA